MFRRLAILIATTLTLFGITAIPASAADYPLSFTGGIGAYPRSSPQVDARTGNALPEGATVTGLHCWSQGDEVTNSYGYTSNIWIKDADGHYWNEAWLLTGYDGVPDGIGQCVTPSEPKPTTTRNLEVSCYGDYCSGKDPEETGCAEDAETIFAEDLESARLEIRWSPTCQTNWARLEQYKRGTYFGEGVSTLAAEQDTGYTQSTSFEGKSENGVPTQTAGQGTYWSPMIYSPTHRVRAVVSLTCGDQGIGASIFDCAMNGKKTTDWA